MTGEEPRRSSLRGRLGERWALLRLLPQAGFTTSVLFVALQLLGALMPIAFSVTTGLLVGSLPAVISSGIASPAGRELWTELALLGAVMLVSRVLGPVSRAFTAGFGRAVDLRLRSRVMAACLAPSDVAHLDDPAVLDLIESARGVSVWASSPGLAVSGLSQILSTRLSGLLALGVIAAFHWWLALAMGAVAWYVLWTKQRLYLRMSTDVTSRGEDLRRARYLRDLVLRPEEGKELRVFGLGPWLTERFETSWLAALADVWRARRRGSGPVALAMLLRGGVAVLALVLVAATAVRRGISLGAAVIFAQAVNNSAMLSYSLGRPELYVAQGSAAAGAGNALEARLGSSSTKSASAKTRLAERAHQASRAVSVVPGTGANTTVEEEALVPGLLTQSVRFEKVCFAYPNSDAYVLRDLDLEIPAGKSLAIVGDNGAGKTTIVKLLACLYRPTGGRIVVDGVELTRIDPRAWQRQVTAIFQDFVRLPLSASENVSWGCLGAPLDQHRLEEVARLAGALELIESLPSGWDTVLSRQYRGGADLSGGQWQRVALARALYAVRGGARVLILDEPTAQLDVRAEASLYGRFLELTAGSTSIVISHRFSTVRRAEHVVVLGAGRVLEQGSHDELVALGGRYAAAFNLQATRFNEEPGVA
jgi:ATP-binding cassette subfamily B protein